MASGQFNLKNTAIKRIHADIRELQKDASDQYYAEPLEDNIFEWHFTIRGPTSTEFEGGIYHGRILLPSDYPFKPPNIVLLTPNGRFKVGEKICLSISAHHPEYWQPAWGVRLILEALISFLPTPGNGALGSLDWTPDERKALATESREWECAKCGLAKALLPEPKERKNDEKNNPTFDESKNKYLEQVAQLHIHGVPPSPGKQGSSGSDDYISSGGRTTPTTLDTSMTNQKQETLPEQLDLNNQQQQAVASPENPHPEGLSSPLQRPRGGSARGRKTKEDRKKEEDDKILTVIYALIVAILALVTRKIMKLYS